MFALKFLGGGGTPVPVRGVHWQALVNLSCVLKFDGREPPKGRNIVSRKMQFGLVQTHISFSVVSGAKFIGLSSWNAGGIAGERISFRFLISCPVPEIFAIEVWSCLKSCQILHVFWPQCLCGEGPPNFWSCIIKNTHIAIMWQSFTAIGRGSSEIAWRQKKNICSQT